MGPNSEIVGHLESSRGFSNVPWRKHAFGPGTKYVFCVVFLGNLSAPAKRGR